MTAFLAEMGKKIADRWLDLLVLPGLLWIATVIAGIRLGQRQPFDIDRLRTWLDSEATHASSHSLGTVALGAVGLFAISAAAGLGASAVGAVLQRVWVLPADRPPLRWLLTVRQRRWDSATTRMRTAMAVAANPAAHHADPALAMSRASAAERRRAARGAARPRFPTRVADRFHAAVTGIDTAYGLDLELAWPRLWTLVSDTLRADLTAVQDAYSAAARLIGWGLLYVVLAIVWWPAAVLGIAVLTTGWLRVRSTAPVLADLIETAADLHTADLATKLGVPSDLPLTPRTGQAITRALRHTGRPSPE